MSLHVKPRVFFNDFVDPCVTGKRNCMGRMHCKTGELQQLFLTGLSATTCTIFLKISRNFERKMTFHYISFHGHRALFLSIGKFP